MTMPDENLLSRFGLSRIADVPPVDTGVVLSSPSDPIGEAARFVASKDLTSEAVIVVGFGDGHHALEIARKIGKKKPILLVEAIPGVFRRAMSIVDISPLLRSGARFHLGDDAGKFSGVLNAFIEETSVDSISVIVHPPSLRTHEFHRRAIDEIKHAINRRQVGVVTLIRHARLLETNAFRNVGYFIGAHGVDEFAGAFRGRPVIVVAAGPSLSEAIPSLQKIVGRIPIVAVGKACKLLRSRGIAPDFVVALDMLPESAACMEATDGIPLVFDIDCCHEVVAAHGGGLITGTSNTPLAIWAEGFCAAKKGILAKGQSVAHTAFSFAVMLGASPIVLVGVDLSFPGSKTHAEGTAYTWGGDVDKMSGLVDVASVSGGTVKSLKSFQSFISTFEDEISRSGVAVYNASPGGALIRGAMSIDLADWCDGLLPTQAGDIRPVIDGIMATPVAFNLPLLFSKIARIKEEASAALALCERGLGWAKRLSYLDPANKADVVFRRKIDININDARKQIMQSNPVRVFRRLLAETEFRMKENLAKMNKFYAAGNRADGLKVRDANVALFFSGVKNAMGQVLEIMKR